MANIAKFHNRLGLEPVSADPASPSQGELQYSDGTARAEGVWRYNGSTWVNLESAGLENVVSTSSATYNATSADNIILCDTSSNNVTVNLPAASGNDGLNITVIKTAGASNQVTVDGSGTETIDGETTIDMPSINDSIVMVCDGSNWKSKSREIKIALKYTSNAGTSYTSGSTVVCEDLVYDTHSAYNSGTGIFTAPTDGEYLVESKLATNATGWTIGLQQQTATYLNATAEDNLEVKELQTSDSSGNNLFISTNGSSIIRCSSGDTIEVRMFHTRGGSLATTTSYFDNSIAITRIGD